MVQTLVSNAIMDCLLLLLGDCDGHAAQSKESNGHAPFQKTLAEQSEPNKIKTFCHVGFWQHSFSPKEFNRK